jgi:hypothetical protein
MQPAPPLPLAEYLAGVDFRAAQQRFAMRPDAPQGLAPERVYHRREFSITKFGVVDTMLVLKYIPPDQLSPEAVRWVGTAVFDFALANKSIWPRGFFGAVVAYPVCLTNMMHPAVATHMQLYQPTHWASFEFPAVIDLTQRQIAWYAGTPVWGWAYYDGFRRELASLCQPW